jgi:cellulose synthase/poly-beta-1,6-N-acetylglucosamine synthase-like glycosyltransferase
VVVASGCPESVLSRVRTAASTDPRVTLIEESERHGKAEAINRILERSVGEFVVMLNSDAFPTPGSVRNILGVAADPTVGAVSAEPMFDCGDGILERSLVLMWSAHNLLSLRLNHAGISNHACDELIVVRRRLVPRLPSNVVNDGAYIGGLVRAHGLLVKFSTAAKVKIAIPNVLVDLLRQRRRILFGHVQVWKKLGRPPRTIESMLFMDPLVSLKTVVKIMSEKPRLIAAIPVVLVGESVSGLMALADVLGSTERHIVWKRNAE